MWFEKKAIRNSEAIIFRKNNPNKNTKFLAIYIPVKYMYRKIISDRQYI